VIAPAAPGGRVRLEPESNIGHLLKSPAARSARDHPPSLSPTAPGRPL